MKISTKGKYAIIAMHDISIHGDKERSVSLADVANRQQVSLSYLEQLFAKLKKAGLVMSVRGPGGGYVLGRAKNEITLSEIVLAVDSSINTQNYIKPTDSILTVNSIWMDLRDCVMDHLKTITLEG